MKKVFYLIIYIVMTSILLLGCSAEKEQEKEFEKVDSELEDLEKSIEGLVTLIGGPSKEDTKAKISFEEMKDSSEEESKDKKSNEEDSKNSEQKEEQNEEDSEKKESDNSEQDK